MRTTPILILMFSLAGLSSPVTSRALDAQTAAKERVWEGYLFRRPGGPLRLGWGVIAMGVMAQGSHEFGPELRRQLAPFASDVPSDYFFWNYGWIGTSDEKGLPKTDVARVPRVLVRVRGPVSLEDAEGNAVKQSHAFMNSETRTMKTGRVLSVEFVSEAWLKAWQDLIRLGFNPYWHRPEKAIEGDAEKVSALAAQVIPALVRMKKLSTVTPEEVEKAHRIDPQTKAVNHFRSRMEDIPHRWLFRMKDRHGLELKGIEALGTLPPSEQELVDWFCAAENRDAFLGKVASRYKSDLDKLQMYYYLAEGRSISYTKVTVDEVGGWSNETFRQHQAASRKILKKK